MGLDHWGLTGWGGVCVCVVRGVGGFMGKPGTVWGVLEGFSEASGQGCGVEEGWTGLECSGEVSW